MNGCHQRFGKIPVVDIFMEAENEKLIKRKNKENNETEKLIVANKSYCIFTHDLFIILHQK